MAKVGAGGSFWPLGGRIEMRKGRPADGLFLLTAAMARHTHLPTSVLYSGHICDLDHVPHSACLRTVIWITANVLKST